MRLSKEFDALFQGFDQWKQFKWVLGLLALISSCFSVSIVGFTRKDFGERYYGIINLFFGYTIIANFTFLGNLIGVAAGRKFSWLMVLFWLAFLCASFYHRREITRKNKAGIEWHSMCQGTSILPLPSSEENIFKIWEPLLVFLFGVLCWKLSAQIAIWLMIGGVSLLVNNHLVYHFERQDFLNARDAGIRAKHISNALQGKPASASGGFVLAASTVQMVRKDATLRGVLANISPEVKQFLDADSDFDKAA